MNNNKGFSKKTINENKEGNFPMAHLAINLKPKKIIGPRPIKAPTDYSQLVLRAGFVELDPATIANEGLTEYLPEGFGGGQLTAALHLWSSGISSSHLEQKINQSPIINKLSEKQKRSLYGLAYLVRVFEEAAPEETLVLQQIYSPEITFQEAPPEVRVPPKNQYLFRLSEDTIQPVIREAVGRGTDLAKTKIKGFVTRAIKEGGKKVVKEAAKKLVNIGTKAGVTAAAQAAGTLIPVIGNIAAFIATEVIPRVLGAIKKGLSRLGEWLTGEKDKGKQIAIIAATAAAVFLGLGLPIAALTSIVVAVGAGALSLGARVIGSGISGFVQSFIFGVTAVVIPSMAIPLVITLIITPLAIVLIIFIINSGAFVVPRSSQWIYLHGPGPGEVPGDCIGNDYPKPHASGIRYSPNGGYAFPVAPYGETYHTCGHWDGTLATDIGIIGVTENGAQNPVVAYVSGTIEMISLNDSLGGKYIILRGTDGRYYYYAHNCALYVTPGQWVSVGEVIATTDNTGSAAGTPEHLHFAISSSPSFFNGGTVCPSTDFEDKFGLGKCTPAEQCPP